MSKRMGLDALVEKSVMAGETTGVFETIAAQAAEWVRRGGIAEAFPAQAATSTVFTTPLFGSYSDALMREGDGDVLRGFRIRTGDPAGGGKGQRGDRLRLPAGEVVIGVGITTPDRVARSLEASLDRLQSELRVSATPQDAPSGMQLNVRLDVVLDAEWKSLNATTRDELQAGLELQVERALLNFLNGWRANSIDRDMVNRASVVQGPLPLSMPEAPMLRVGQALVRPGPRAYLLEDEDGGGEAEAHPGAD